MNLKDYALSAMGLLLIVAWPPFLLLTNVQLLMSTVFVRYEYGKADFPASPGFSEEERLLVAEKAISYLRSDQDINVLRELGGEQGPLFQERELAHMVDVKRLTQWAFGLHKALGLLIGVGLILLLIEKRARKRVPFYLLYGSLLTIALFALVALLAYLNFNWLFVRFHRTFFEGDSWIFSYSDALIRLYPVRFWFDAIQTLALLTLGEAALLGGVMGGVRGWALPPGSRGCR